MKNWNRGVVIQQPILEDKDDGDSSSSSDGEEGGDEIESKLVERLKLGFWTDKAALCKPNELLYHSWSRDTVILYKSEIAVKGTEAERVKIE